MIRASRWRALGVAALLALAFAPSGCDAASADPRAQLVVIVDTDINLQDLLATDADRAAAAAIDSVRVDVFAAGDDGTLSTHRVITAASVADWPLSFGVEPPEDGGHVVSLRIRGFSSRLATRGLVGEDPTLDPAIVGTIDRLVDVDVPEREVQTVRVVLRGDCLGVPASFARPARTCVDGERRSVDPSLGVRAATPTEREQSEAGTWAHARDTACDPSLQPPDAICVAGGFDLLGHESFTEFDGTVLDSAPLRQVLLRPFYLDRMEVTVGRFRDLVRTTGLAERPFPLDPEDGLGRHCTWLSVDDPGNDALPLNCVPVETAEAACALWGGALPTEAQVERAMRGRGRARLYPWGDGEPACCSASLSRSGPELVAASCGEGLEAAGSHVAPSGCVSVDVSFDGIVDLAGSLTELTADAPEGFDGPCWRAPPDAPTLVDPVCRPGAAERVARGGHWNADFTAALAPLRSTHQLGPQAGFRCAYRGSP